MANITQKRLCELLHYDQNSGLFTWASNINSRARKGALAGCFNADGYTCIGIDGVLYVAHRLAFLYMTGKFPDAQTDHINGNRTDNRWENLREATIKANTQNRRNAPKTNKSSGVLGVTFEPKSVLPWRARIKVDGKKIHLGTFATKEAAHSAYVAAKRLHHPGCTL